MKILLTSFQPFRGRERNASQTIASALAALPSTDQRLHLTLPVIWGSIETIALPEIEAFQPDLILGLGEGTPDSLKIETRATNQRHGLDESNTPPPSATIDPDGPAETDARWPMLPNLHHSFPPVQLSTDAGRYLCNNALYRYAQTNATFAAFLHLPPQATTPNADYLNQWLPNVQALLSLAQ